MITKLGSKVLGGMLLGLLLLILREPVAAQKLEKMRVGYNAITSMNSSPGFRKRRGSRRKMGLTLTSFTSSPARGSPRRWWPAT